MSKIEQAFNNLCFHIDLDTTDYVFNGNYEEDSKIIDTALKALIAIINKEVDMWEIYDVRDYTEYLTDHGCYRDEYCLTKEEFDAIVEMIRYEKGLI